MIGRRDLVAKGGVAGLLGWASTISGSTSSEAAMGSGRVAPSLGDLAAAPPANLAMIHNGAIFLWSTGNFEKPPLGPADGRSVVKQNDTPLAAGAWIRQPGPLTVEAFGAMSGAQGIAAANTAAFTRAIATAADLGVPLHLKGGIYRLDASGAKSGGVNFARPGLHVRGDGATLQFEGLGRAFVLDQGGKAGDVIEGLSISDITIVGGPGVSDGFYMRGVCRSAFRNITVLDVAGKAFWIKHGVSCHFDSMKYSPLRPGQTAPDIAATHGLFIDNNDTPGQREGYYSADCVFTNAVMEGFPGVGCHVADGSGHVFIGGTFEACRIGLTVAKRSVDNVFFKVWMEGNSFADAIVNAGNTGFLAPKFMSMSQSGPNVRIMPGANGTWFAGGGYVRHVDMAAGSTGTSFHQVGVAENKSGTIGFQGAGAYTRIGCTKIGPDNDVVGSYGDIIGPVDAVGMTGSWAPVLSPARGAVTAVAASTSGTYHKVGKLVFAQCKIVVDRASAAQGDLSIKGLPYPAGTSCAGAVHTSQWNTAGGSLQVRIEPNSTVLSLSRLPHDAAADLAGGIRGGATMTISITYPSAD